MWARRRETEIRAEAAVWLARIHSEDARDSDIADFHIWVAEDLRHQQAFDAVTSVWEAVGGIAILDGFQDAPENPKTRSLPSRRTVLVTTAGVAAVAAGIWKFTHEKPQAGTVALKKGGPESYSTKVGEQRRVVLPDGSLAILDTSSSIQVDFQEHSRTVDQLDGRANFEVTHNPQRPFIVNAGDTRVVALGTSFEVSRSPNSVGVVLVTGKIQVIPVADESPESGVELSTPGEHMLLSGHRVLMHNSVDLAAATAWQDGRVVFDNETLARAVAEMNRYSHRRITLSPEIEQLRISGNYRTGDSEAFATTLTALLPLSATFAPAEILLRRNSPKSGNAN